MSSEDKAGLERHEDHEADQVHRRRRRIDNFLMLARNAQNARDSREQVEQRQIEEERKAWDDTIEQIRRIHNEHEQDFDH